MRRFLLFLLVLPLAIATLVGAQSAASSIGGTVRDTSGAVLPGVTVEISSPALAEGTRTVTTDGAGQYRFSNLRSGLYRVKFVLKGFTTVERTAFQLL
jgi:protocatechuate 3,4-dioxygenase beta subunit